MRASKAYIASLGTTGLLLAFSASLLLLVGTLFAFDAWPGADIRDAVESVLVDDDGDDAVRVSGPEQVARDASPAALAVAARPTGGGAPGGDAGDAFGGSGGGTTGPGTIGDGGFGGGGGGGTGEGITPTTGGGTPISGAPTVDTGQGTNQLADSTEQVTNSLGNAVGEVTPNLGNTVTETGQALTDIVRDLPDVKVGGGSVNLGN
jgi:hypothetical protein